MRKLIIAASAVALSVPTVVVPTSPAEAARTWRGKDGRVYCRRPNGTTGLLVGGAAGALVGSAVTHGAAGPIIGAAGGALLGRHIERNNARARCVARR